MIGEKLKYFHFKKYPQDFIVEEKLFQLPKGKGHVFYVFFEKKFFNTMDVVKHLSKTLNLKRKHFGIGGLKDKDGITRQRISIYKRTLESRGGVDNFLKQLSKFTNILKYSWSDRLLKVGDIKGNLFFIRLRPKIKVNYNFKNKIEKALQQIKIQGFPNYFGYQRFGKKYRNVKLGFEFLTGKRKIHDHFEKQFKLQAVSSFLFNKYLDLRIEKSFLDIVLIGDIILADNLKLDLPIIKKGKQKLAILGNQDIINDLISNHKVIPSGPVVGYDILLPPNNTLPYQMEINVFKKNNFDMKFLKTYKENEIYGIRRQIKVYIQDLRYKWDKDDLLLMFELPSGSYASVVVTWIEKLIDKI